MKIKYSIIFICIMCILSSFVIVKIYALEQKNQLQQVQQSQQENQLPQIQQLQQELSNLKNSFYDKTIQNVNLALQGANRATSLVSVSAITFTVFTIILGFWGIRELSSIRKVRLDAENNLKLTKHFSLGYTYTHSLLYLEALKEFLKVVEIDANNEIAHTQLGYLYLSLPIPDYTKSKFHSKRATEINPSNYIAYLNLGVAMNSIRDKQEDVLSVYLKGERAAIDQMADDLTIGKLELFAGHCYKNLNDKGNAKAKYDEARRYLIRCKDSQIKELFDIGQKWLNELEESYRIVSA